MLVGIGTIGLVIGKLAEWVINIATSKLNGMGTMHCTNHIIIMGYRRGGTEKVVTELLAHRPDEKIVLCSSEAETNPLCKAEVDFVRGELSSADVLGRASAAGARSVIIHRKDDDSTFFTAYAFREANPSAHMICYLTDESHASKIRSLPADDTSLNQVVLPANVYLMAQEVEDRESSAVIQCLISNLTGHNLYRYDIPAHDSVDCSFFDAFVALKKSVGVTLVAIKDKSLNVNPGLEERSCPGMSVFYTGESRLAAIDFACVRAHLNTNQSGQSSPGSTILSGATSPK
jgi:voltage-gated potassium channel